MSPRAPVVLITRAIHNQICSSCALPRWQLRWCASQSWCTYKVAPIKVAHLSTGCTIHGHTYAMRLSCVSVQQSVRPRLVLALLLIYDQSSFEYLISQSACSVFFIKLWNTINYCNYYNRSMDHGTICSKMSTKFQIVIRCEFTHPTIKPRFLIQVLKILSFGRACSK